MISQWQTPPRRGKCYVISMEFLPSFTRFHFAGGNRSWCLEMSAVHSRLHLAPLILCANNCLVIHCKMLWVHSKERGNIHFFSSIGLLKIRNTALRPPEADSERTWDELIFFSVYISGTSKHPVNSEWLQLLSGWCLWFKLFYWS